MPVANTDNIKRWLEQSDIDYFTYFTKAWIPFNAWYRKTYDTLDRERDILDEIKTDGNRIRQRLMTKLEGADPESEEIRNHIAQLHRRLSVDPLKDNKDRAISFENVSLGRNPKMRESQTFYRWSYTVERKTTPTKQTECEVKNKSGAVVITIIQPGDWNDDDLQIHPDFVRLHPAKRPALLTCYRAVNPWLFDTLLAPAAERNPIEMDGYKFVRNPDKSFAGMVDVLYSLRCLLMHGELVPDGTSNRTYEPAYHLVRTMIRCLV